MKKKNVYIRVQNLGSSLLSPQSSLLSQNCASEMHLLFAHEYSLIEHFWLLTAVGFNCDCFALRIVVATKHKHNTTILILFALIIFFAFNITWLYSLYTFHSLPGTYLLDSLPSLPLSVISPFFFVCECVYILNFHVSDFKYAFWFFFPFFLLLVLCLSLLQLYYYCFHMMP